MIKVLIARKQPKGKFCIVAYKKPGHNIFNIWYTKDLKSMTFEQFVNDSRLFLEDKQVDSAINGTIYKGNKLKSPCYNHILIETNSKEEAWKELQELILMEDIIK